jgi:hypothetical protein
MRKLSTSIVVIGLLGSTQALAQEAPAAAEPAPEPAPAEPEVAPAAAAPAPEPAAPVATPAASQPKAVVVQMGDVGGAPSTRGVAAGPGLGAVGGPISSKEDEWKFGFHGYFRAPMRIGIGKRMNAKEDQAESTLSVPQIPNDQYLDWNYSKTVQRSWAETYLSFGNKYAKGVIGLEAFQFTESSWSNGEAQFGIAQGWVELTPDMAEIDDSLKLVAKAGTFFGRYGGAGQYDAGAYDAFIAGRTHTMGETIRLEYEAGDFIWSVEEGFGTNQPNPSPVHNTKFTLLAHGHVGMIWDQFITVGLHYFHAWTQEPDHACVSREEETAQQVAAQNAASASDPAVVEQLARFGEAAVGACKWEDQDVVTDTGIQRRADSADGSMDVIAGDIVVNAGLAGRFFFGGNVILAKNAYTIGPAIEVNHADGGGFFKMGVTHQFLNQRDGWDDVGNPSKGNRFGTGQIMTLEGQWDLSISSLLEMTQQLDLQAFMMFTNVLKSEDDDRMTGVTKLKFGADLEWNPISWFGVGFRFDQVNPRSDHPMQSFTALAPRLVFRSDYGTHEEIEIGYAHYIYAKNSCDSYTGVAMLDCVQVPGAAVGPDGFGLYPGVNASKAYRGTTVDIESERGPFPDGGWDPPHENIVYISASMWW